MKKLLIAAVIIAGLAVGLPPLFGVWTEAMVRERVAELNESESIDADVTIIDYERGWFRSRSEVEISPAEPLDAFDAAAAMPPMRVGVDLFHGPVSFASGFYLGLARMQARPLEGTSPVDFTFDAQTTFGRTVHFAAAVERYEQTSAEGAVTFSGGRIYGTAAGQNLTADLEVETVRAVSPTGTFVGQGMHARAENEWLGERDLAPGRVQVTFSRVGIEPNAAALGVAPQMTGGMLEIANLAVATRLDFDAENRIVSTSEITADTLRTPNGETTRPQLRFTISGIDAAWVETWIATSAAYGGTPPPQVMEPMITELVVSGPALSIDTLRFESNSRPFDATLSLAIDGEAAQAAAAGGQLFQNPLMWVGILFGEVSATASKSLVEETFATVTQAQNPGGSPVAATAQSGLILALLTSQGLLEDRGEAYHFNAKLERGGRLTVNGRPMPLPF